MPYVTNRGARLYWEEHGSGPPVLLIMGLSFTLEMWFRVVPHLIQSYRVILFDNRGIGRSDVPRGPYTIPTMASDAIAVLDAAGVAAAHVVGASMGGMIAQELTLRYPERVHSLILGCTACRGLFSKWPNFRKGPNQIGWFRADRLQRERGMRQMLYAVDTLEELIEEDIGIRCRCNWTYKGVLSQLAGILLWSSYRRLPSIKAPTLVVHGEEDHLLPPQNGQLVASRIPGARFELMPRAGHIFITDQPETTMRHLLGFLQQVSEEMVESPQPVTAFPALKKAKLETEPRTQ
ncbi:MAG: alpha/beta fold hydrolase [Acidobacteriaceae bacterium]|nr:alpha/beta fold hydrolase [Acidobacteriaceae bacterium]